MKKIKAVAQCFQEAGADAVVGFTENAVFIAVNLGVHTDNGCIHLEIDGIGKNEDEALRVLHSRIEDLQKRAGAFAEFFSGLVDSYAN